MSRHAAVVRYAGEHRVAATASRLPVAVVAFVVCVAAANGLTGWLGLVPVGFGLSATAGTWAAGFVLTARDWVHEVGGGWAAVACIAGGTLLSAAVAGPRLAMASAVAFAVSELVDALVYEPMRALGWVPAVLASNLVGAVMDTMLFLTLAGFLLTGPIVVGQLWVKTVATLVLVAAVVTTRAVLRDRVRSPGS